MRSRTRILWSFTLALSLVLAACGGDTADTTTAPETTEPTGTTADPGTDTTKPSDTTEPMGDAAPVALIIAQGGLGDQAYNDLANEGLQLAGENLGVEVQPVEAEDIVAEGEQVVRRAAESGFGLIIDLEFSHNEFFPVVAAEYPDANFAFVNLPIEGDNILSIVFREHEGSFLAGALAAMMTSHTDNEKINEDKIIGAIGGVKSAGIDKFIVGFIQGAQYIDPEVEVLVTYIDDFGDPSKGQAAASAMYDQGSDIVYQIAGGAGLGVFEAAEAANHYAIGVDTDQDFLKPGHILTSMVKRVDLGVEETVTQYVDGTFEGGSILDLGLAVGGVGLTEFEHTRGEIPDEFVTQIDEIRQMIIDGEIEIWNVIEQGYPDFFSES